MKPTKSPVLELLCLAVVSSCSALYGSSHREAPFITQVPKVDITDFYMFQSYDASHIDDNNVTVLIANFQPLQDSFGGPNYFFPDENALYSIHIDNDGDAIQNFTFRFQFDNTFDLRQVTTDDGTMVEIPLTFNLGGVITVREDPDLSIVERYSLFLVQGGTPTTLNNLTLGGTVFVKPVDNIATMFIPDYSNYASQHVFEFDIPGFPDPGKVFVGQRLESFVANPGVFGVGVVPDGNANALAAKNITSLVIEVPTAFLTDNGLNPVIGAWATSSVRRDRVLNSAPTNPDDVVQPPLIGNPFVQVSRLGMPLVNQLVIGLRKKDTFNASQPVNDPANFMVFFTNPSLAEIFGIPSAMRTDVVDFFLNGLPGLNQTGGIGEMLRLDTTVAPKPLANQDPFGFFGAPQDFAGYPNGRRPVDDVVDITYKVIGGALIPIPGTNQLSDGVPPEPGRYLAGFPYLKDPIPGDADIACVELECSFDLPGPFTKDPDARFDSASRTFTTTKPALDRNFYRVRSNMKVLIDRIDIVGPDVEIQFSKKAAN